MKSMRLLLLPAIASSFSIASPNNIAFRRQKVFLAAEEKNKEKADPGLVLDGLDQEMNQFTSEFAFSESDYLAAARKRAEERKESVNSGASDDEWKKIAEEKETQYGTIDDWENAVKEAGNVDSQILMFTDPPADGDDEDGEGGDSKLLLF